MCVRETYTQTVCCNAFPVTTILHAAIKYDKMHIKVWTSLVFSKAIRVAVRSTVCIHHTHIRVRVQMFTLNDCTYRPSYVYSPARKFHPSKDYVDILIRCKTFEGVSIQEAFKMSNIL